MELFIKELCSGSFDFNVSCDPKEILKLSMRNFSGIIQNRKKTYVMGEEMFDFSNTKTLVLEENLEHFV